MHRPILIAAALALLAGPALANGAISEFRAGGVEFKEAADIAIEKEDLYLSVRQVLVRYEYRSDATETQRVTIGFPMPPVPLDGSPDYLGGGDATALAESRNYLDFSATVDGVPVNTILHEFAFLGGKDVTVDLLAAGLPVFIPYEARGDVLAGVDHATLDALAERGFFYASEGGLDSWEPLWSYQTVFEWEQDFAPGKTVVEIGYVPLNGYPGDIGQSFEGGGEYDDPAFVAERSAEYCIDDAMVAAIKKRKGAGGYEVVTQGYTLTTGNYWKGPIGEFNLVVDKADAAEGMDDLDLVAFCPLEAKKFSDTQFRWSARDFEPKRDISVVYYQFYDVE